MLKLENLIDDVPSDEFTEIHEAFRVSAELEADARSQLLARANGNADISAYIEQLKDVSILREKYVSRLLAMVKGS